MKRWTICCCLLLAVATARAQMRFEMGERAPRFTVERLEGGTFRTNAVRGRVVLLSFWATWCRPCLKELEEVPAKLLQRFEGRDFTFLAIAVNEPRTTVSQMAERLAGRGIRFPIGLDHYGKIGAMTGDDRLPQLLLLDCKGIVRLHETGYTPERLDEVAARIEELLAE